MTFFLLDPGRTSSSTSFIIEDELWHECKPVVPSISDEVDETDRNLQLRRSLEPLCFPRCVRNQTMMPACLTSLNGLERPLRSAALSKEVFLSSIVGRNV